MHEDTRPIKGIIADLLKDLKKEKLFKKDLVEKAWQKIAGKKAAKHARISSLRGGRLVVEVDNSAWMYELTLKKQEMLKSLNNTLSKKDIEINEIQFRIGNSGGMDAKREG